MTNEPAPPKPDMSGFIRILAKSIAEKLIEDQKRVSLAHEKTQTAPGPSESPSVQRKGKKRGFLGDVEPRPPPFEPSNHKLGA